jgi:hypothetical protein
MMVPKPLPLDALKPDLMKTLIATTARKLAFGEAANPRDQFAMAPPETKKKGDVQTFIDEVNKLSDNGKLRPTDKEKFAALQKYIVDFVSKRGIMLHGNAAPLSEWNLEESPELGPLVEAQKNSLKSSPHQQGAYVPFANRFFWEQGRQRTPVATIYHPEFYPEQLPQARNPFDTEPKPQFVVWRTEEVAAKTPASLADAMPAAKALWKHLKAREMAEKRANQLADAIRAGGPGNAATLPFTLLDQSNALAAEFAKDPRARDRIMPFVIEGVCPLTTVANPSARKGIYADANPSSFAALQPFQFPPSENVKYPSRTMGQTVLDERTKDVKTVLVLPDEPRDIYFVVTLMKRDMKTDREFQAVMTQDDEIMRRMGRPSNKMTVLNAYNASAGRKTFESIMGLLKREFKYEESEEQKKKLDERRGGES